MRVAAAGKKKLGEWDDGNSLLAGRLQSIQRTGPGRQNSGTAIDLLEPKGGGASKDKLMIDAPKGVVSGILGKSAAEISLRTNVTRGGEGIECEVLAFCTFQRTVALIPDVSKTRTADVSGQGEQTEFGG